MHVCISLRLSLTHTHTRTSFPVLKRPRQAGWPAVTQGKHFLQTIWKSSRPQSQWKRRAEATFTTQWQQPVLLNCMAEQVTQHIKHFIVLNSLILTGSLAIRSECSKKVNSIINKVLWIIKGNKVVLGVFFSCVQYEKKKLKKTFQCTTDVEHTVLSVQSLWGIDDAINGNCLQLCHGAFLSISSLSFLHPSFVVSKSSTCRLHYEAALIDVVSKSRPVLTCSCLAPFVNS